MPEHYAVQTNWARNFNSTHYPIDTSSLEDWLQVFFRRCEMFGVPKISVPMALQQSIKAADQARFVCLVNGSAIAFCNQSLEQQLLGLRQRYNSPTQLQVHRARFSNAKPSRSDLKPSEWWDEVVCLSHKAQLGAK